MLRVVSGCVVGIDADRELRAAHERRNRRARRRCGELSRAIDVDGVPEDAHVISRRLPADSEERLAVRQERDTARCSRGGHVGSRRTGDVLLRLRVDILYSAEVRDEAGAVGRCRCKPCPLSGRRSRDRAAPTGVDTRVGGKRRYGNELRSTRLLRLQSRSHRRVSDVDDDIVDRLRLHPRCASARSAHAYGTLVNSVTARPTHAARNARCCAFVLGGAVGSMSLSA